MGALAEQLRKIPVRVLSNLPRPLVRVLAGRPVRIDGQQLDPEVQVAIRLERLIGASRTLPVAEKRALRRRDARVFAGPPIELERVEDLQIQTAQGSMRARLYAPHGISEPAPLVVYFHGGGHVIGDLDTHDQPCRFLAREVAALVLAVDYRLAPEHRFPAAVDDALAGFRWAWEEAARLGADPGRIAVAGDSAGANLAAVVCRLARDEGGPTPAFQVLIYPVIDLSAKRRSHELFGEGFFLTSEEMDWYRGHYLASEQDRTDPRASPILVADLSGLPPALLVTAGFDPLRDEGEDYATRLREAGVEVRLRREPDLVHGFISAVGLGGRAREAGLEIAAALRTALAQGAGQTNRAASLS